MGARGRVDLGGDAPSEGAEADRPLAAAPDPATATAEETGGILVAGTAGPVVQTRDPYHGVRDRGQCGPAARAVRRCGASPNYLRLAARHPEDPAGGAPGECTIGRATACHASGTVVSPSANTRCSP
jgi:hypothetical protein